MKILLAALALAGRLSAGAPARLERAGGLVSAAFPTPAGTIWVNLPEDLAPADRASGTLASEPSGATAMERKANGEKLARYRVEIGAASAAVGDRLLRFQVPGPGPVSLLLRDARGAVAGRAEVPTIPPPPAAASFIFPRAGQAGGPTRVRGPFLGDLTGTSVRIGGRAVEMLAESPRDCVFRAPSEPTGETEIAVTAGERSGKAPYRNFSVRLESPNTNLKSGQTTPMTVTVDGLLGYGKPLPLELTNLSTDVVSMEGGAEQHFTIPVSAEEKPAFSLTRTLTGIVPGDFHIQAILRWEEENAPQLVDDNRPEPKHHCAAGRLIVVIGDFKNPTIAAAIDWARKEAAKKDSHVHVVIYKKPPSGTPSFDAPYLPGEKEPFRFGKKGGGGGNRDLAAQEWNDCCFFSQVILLFHGNDFSWPVFVDQLPGILNGRVARQVTLWSCESTDQFFPKSSKGSQKAYGNIGWTLRPRACPCECDPAMAAHKGAACPTAADAVTIYASAGFRGKASKLEIDPNGASPLKSPSGTMRKISIAADGSMTTTETAASDPPDVFDGFKVGASGKLPDANAEKYDKEKFEADARVDSFEGSKKNFPVPEVKYNGPHACPNKEGCLPDPI
jgi:hypothetical protein